MKAQWREDFFWRLKLYWSKQAEKENEKYTPTQSPLHIQGSFIQLY